LQDADLAQQNLSELQVRISPSGKISKSEPVILQDLGQARLHETVEELTDKLSTSVDAVLSLSNAELTEAVEAYSSMGRDGRPGVIASDEDEDLFTCRAALLRLHHLQLLTKVPSEAPQFYTSLHKLLQVSKHPIWMSVRLSACGFNLHAYLFSLYQLYMNKVPEPHVSLQAVSTAVGLTCIPVVLRPEQLCLNMQSPCCSRTAAAESCTPSCLPASFR